ncbi:MAG: hypothetical protein IRF12RH_06300 [Rickettsia helvetica]|uniref:Uncharacterized protein n=1 Tax=Rickettsia helvetica TaxID=35789 RepID=A0ABM9NDF1_RICHE
MLFLAEGSVACMDTKSSLRATKRSMAISGFLYEIASSKFSIFPRNDDEIDLRTELHQNIRGTCIVIFLKSQ